MLWFCRKLKKIIANTVSKTLLLMLVQILSYLLIVLINWALFLIILKTRDAFFWGSILTPNTRNLSLITLHLKPKVVNVLTKTLSETSLLWKTFSLIFPLYKYFFETHASRMSSLTLSTNICCYWLKWNSFQTY